MEFKAVPKFFLTKHISLQKAFFFKANFLGSGGI
jgi:hypothetical protein